MAGPIQAPDGKLRGVLAIHLSWAWARRLAGDEFVVVLELLNDARDAERKANLLLQQLSRPFELPSGSVQVGASIGVALQLLHDAPDPAGLPARADQAMYRAKREDKGRVALVSPAPS